MSLALIDAREWQNRFDLETGRKSSKQGPLVDMLGKVLSRHPYPGDVNEGANLWVTRTALDLVDHYAPDLVCLSYVQQFFANRHFSHAADTRDIMYRSAMVQAMTFIEATGYTPVIVGTGPLVPLKNDIDLSGLDGLAISSNWSARYCGLHRPSQNDLAIIQSIEGVERIVSKADWIDTFYHVEPDLEVEADPSLMPDYLIVAKEGYAFKTLGTTLRKPVNVPANNFEVPVYTTLDTGSGALNDIRQIKNLVLKGLDTRKIALILLEALDMSYFPPGTVMCANAADWFCHEPGDSFYLTLSTGRHQPFVYPAGYRYFDQDAEQIKFPFSGYMTAIPQNTLGCATPKRSIAVGNRSMFMHMVFGVDISIECFARNLFNQGLMGVIHRGDKFAERN
ncbi:MAG: hypothetical protein D3926_18365 [Desulfobacteraceae bacterium]|nr:MAG: hypothetical protein D3926_18365 [Desulfobacteraceae bacterium]